MIHRMNRATVRPSRGVWRGFQGTAQFGRWTWGYAALHPRLSPYAPLQQDGQNAMSHVDRVNWLKTRSA
jgi:hypothetical protein